MDIKKSKKASLEDKKFTYLLMGFVFVLSVCFVALEWTETIKKHEIADVDIAFEEEVDIDVTTQDNTPPPPPPPPVQQELESIEVVEDDVETEHVEVKGEDNNEVVEIAPPIETKVEVVEEDEQTVFVVVENMPEFPGGTSALMKYLNSSIKYPVIAQENGIQGRVVCQFVVNKDGSIVDIEVARSSGDASLDKEAVRVIKAMPKWTPGKQRGKPVRVKYTLPVNFKLQ